MQYHKSTYAPNIWDVYWFEKNLQGDVVAIYDCAGNKLISYIYDAWGLFSITYETEAARNSSAALNPFRYRGYYYDKDLDLYYLNSRYYDAYTTRFINADRYVQTPTGDILSTNMFAYCGNNPVNMVDAVGEFGFLTILCLVIPTLIGAVAGACSDIKIGATQQEESMSALANKDKSITNEETDKELTVGDRVANAFIGAGLGLAVGGALLMIGGMGAGFAVHSATKVVACFGLSGAQTVALGALTYNVLPLLIAPFMGIEVETVGFGESSGPYIPDNTRK